MGPSTSETKWAKSSSKSLPFGRNCDLKAIGGPTYTTTQSLVQQVAYTLSDQIFSYSGCFELDVAAKEWADAALHNAYGYPTKVNSLQTRNGAAAAVLGYIFSPDFDLKKRRIPQTVLAPSSSLNHLRPSLEELSLLYNVASPFVAHVAAISYNAGREDALAADYASAMSIAEELGYGLIASTSSHEAQHMALLATLLAQIVPTFHIYDGITTGRETTRVVDALGQSQLYAAYVSILGEINALDKKTQSVEKSVLRLVRSLNGELGTAYNLFEYEGHKDATNILVVFGTSESSVAAQVASALARSGEKVGVVTVRVYSPFVEEEFLKIIPSTVQGISVLGQVRNQQAVDDLAVRSKLYTDVLAAIKFSNSASSQPTVTEIKYTSIQSWDTRSMGAILRYEAYKSRMVVSPEQSESIACLDYDTVQQYVFWDTHDSLSKNTPNALGQLLALDSKRNVTLSEGRDNLAQGGIVKTTIRDSKRIIDASFAIDNADVVYIGNEALLKDFDVLQEVKHEGSVILRYPGLKDEDASKSLPVAFRKGLVDKHLNLYILDPLASQAAQDHPEIEEFISQLSFMKVALPNVYDSGFEKLGTINGDLTTLNALAHEVDQIFRLAEYPDSWGTLEDSSELPTLPKNIWITGFEGFEKSETEEPLKLQTKDVIAKAMVFKEAYGATTDLRPDLTVKTYSAAVKENRRLTPASYDRNIFHLEFDLGESGLKYQIGEALGIHAENEPDEVREFISSYGLRPDDVIQVPSREDPNVLESRTVWQALIQNVDIFGRPPKKFYEALGEFASDEKERKQLLTLASPDGAVEFKRRAEVDTITFADVLLEFASAHPSFQDLVRIVNPMKRREYSIASSQVVTPTSVALLVVVVNWEDTRGRSRFGQATRYLNRLRPGDRVTVSVKPSVMKLPALSTQPLIMAGLGTGLAPFRAFVQYRAWQKARGEEIGAVLLYMGSRHQREEYLYGEEWEAYQDAGVITLLGRAFSRDQPQKIYIQDRMRQTLGDIIDAYITQDGAFYLCGPTWPVPDVTDVLEEAISRDAQIKGKKVNSGTEIQRLKEDGRYVLEVY